MVSKKVKYNDHLFILLVVPVIAGINYYLTYSNVQLNSFFFITFVLDTLEGYCAWYAARGIIVWLDGRFPWGHRTGLRLAAQLPLVALVVIATLTVLTELVNAIARDKPVDISFYKYDILIFGIWSLLINSVYAGLYFYQLHIQQRKPNDFIISKSAGVQKVIYFKDVNVFYVDNQVTFACTSDGRHVLSDYTLERIGKLVNTDFYRANRQFIITRQVVDKVVRDREGKLTVILKPGRDYPPELTISRLKAPAFKQWLSATQD